MKVIGKRVGDGIYETCEYNVFQFGNNRPIDRKVVEQKKASIKRIGLLVPIEVTKDFYIKEGQHRFVALKELGLPITYRFSMHDTFNVDEIAEMNSSVNKWALPTFIKVRANDGNPNYIRLKKLMDRYPSIKIAEIKYAIGKGTQKAIRNGWFTMTESEYKMPWKGFSSHTIMDDQQSTESMCFQNMMIFPVGGQTNDLRRNPGCTPIGTMGTPKKPGALHLCGNEPAKGNARAGVWYRIP